MLFCCCYQIPVLLCCYVITLQQCYGLNVTVLYRQVHVGHAISTSKPTSLQISCQLKLFGASTLALAAQPPVASTSKVRSLRPERTSPCMGRTSCAALARRAALRDHHTMRQTNACSTGFHVSPAVTREILIAWIVISSHLGPYMWHNRRAFGLFANILQ